MTGPQAIDQAAEMAADVAGPERSVHAPLYARGSDVPGWLDPVPNSDPAAEVYRLDARVKALFAPRTVTA